MVLAECRGELVQMVAPDIADPGMELLDAGFGLDPVAGELLFAAHGALIPREPLCMAFACIHRGNDLAGGQSGEVRHAHVHTDDAGGRMRRILNCTFGLDAHEPFAAVGRYGDVPYRTQRLPAVAVAQPAELGQKDAAVALIELDLLRLWVAEAVGTSFFLEARKRGTLGEEVGIGALQVLECLLQRVDGCIGQSRGRAP